MLKALFNRVEVDSTVTTYKSVYVCVCVSACPVKLFRFRVCQVNLLLIVVLHIHTSQSVFNRGGKKKLVTGSGQLTTRNKHSEG
jgi:hypothetical protein